MRNAGCTRGINLVSSLSLSLMTIGAIGVQSSAVAQSVLEEVIVTARKRQESLQETPIAITALSGSDLVEGGLRDISDLRKVVPNVDVYSGNGAGGAGNIFIRGVGARNTGVNFDSGVGIYLDNVYISRPDGAILDNVDIESLEVLRGPQGTLFGKNTTGGAVLYATKRPTNQFEGNAEIRLGNLDRRDAKLTVNIPIVEDVFHSRFSAYATKRDGFAKNVLRGDEFSNEDRLGGQAHFLWLPSDDLIVDFNALYAKTDQASRAQNCEVVTGIDGSGWQAGLQDPFIIVPSTGQTIAEHCQDNNDLGIDKVLSDFESNSYTAETTSFAITVDWDFSDDMSFKSVTAFRTTEAGNSTELDATGIPLLHRGNFGGNGTAERTTDQISQEFQVSGTAMDETLDFVFGVFAFSEESDDGKARAPTGPFFGSLFNPNWAFYTNTREELLADNTSYSAFSQTDWHMTDYWSLTVGLRYTWEERKLTRNLDTFDPATLTNDGSTATNLFSSFWNFPNGPGSFNADHGYTHVVTPSGSTADINSQSLKTTNSDWTPMLSIRRLLDEKGFMESGSIYFTVANGFLSGGISESLDPVSQLMTEYDPEDVWNYELGFKMDAFDHRLRLNTALFYMDYSDRQLTSIRVAPDTGRIAPTTINAESSSIMGLEIETQLIPVENLEVTLNLTFNEGEIDTYDDKRIVAPGSLPDSNCLNIPSPGIDLCDVDRSDENLPRLPEEIFFLALQYNWAGDFGVIMPRVQWSRRNGVDNCFDRASCLSELYLVDQEDVSARITWISPDEQWRVSAYGNNLTDERYITGGTPLVDVTRTAGTVYNEPRMYGVEMAYSW